MSHSVFSRGAAASVLAAVLLSGCASAPVVQGEALGAPGLTPVASRRFDELAVAGDAETVRRVHLGALDFEALEIRQPQRQGVGPEREWTLTARERDGLSALWAEALASAIEEQAGVEVVAVPGPGVHELHTSLLRLEPVAAKDDFQSRSGGSTILSRGPGSAQLRIEVSGDGGTLLALVDERDAGSRVTRNDRFHNRVAFERLLRAWAEDVARLLAEGTAV